MDDTERAWQEQRWAEEKALKHEELAQQQRLSLSTTVVSAVSILVAAAGIIASILVASHNSRDQQRQQARSERISSQQFEYNEIVTGLASRAAAVQTNSMRGLTEYVNDSSNFPSTQAQRVGVQDAIATLISFIEDESDVNGSSTLSNYQAPQPVVVSRAIQSLKKLVNDASLGRNAADVSRGNFHGVAHGAIVLAAPSSDGVSRDVASRGGLSTSSDRQPHDGHGAGQGFGGPGLSHEGASAATRDQSQDARGRPQRSHDPGQVTWPQAEPLRPALAATVLVLPAAGRVCDRSSAGPSGRHPGPNGGGKYRVLDHLSGDRCPAASAGPTFG